MSFNLRPIKCRKIVSRVIFSQYLCFESNSNLRLSTSISHFKNIIHLQRIKIYEMNFLQSKKCHSYSYFFIVTCFYYDKRYFICISQNQLHRINAKFFAHFCINKLIRNEKKEWQHQLQSYQDIYKIVYSSCQNVERKFYETQRQT